MPSIKLGKSCFFRDQFSRPALLVSHFLIYFALGKIKTDRVMKRVSETKLVKTFKKELKEYQIRLDDARERVDANVQRGKWVLSKFEIYQDR